MLNHRRPRQTSWTYDDGQQGFVIEALEDIKRGEQIFDSYGKKCNTRFLLNYGFINLNNDGNEFPFKVALDHVNDPLFKQKNDLLGQELGKRTYRAMADLTEENTYKMLSFLRYCEWDGDMMTLVQAKMRDEKARGRHQAETDSEDEIKSYKAENISVLSVRNEKRVLTKLRSLSEDALRQYPTTLAEDEETLKNDDEGTAQITFNHRNCALFVKGEKEILHWFIELADFADRIMGMKFKEAKRETANLPASMENCREYFSQAIIPLMLKEQGQGAQ